MKQTLKNIALSSIAALLIISVYNNQVSAEWFNSRAPGSDTSTLRGIRTNLDRIANQLEKLVELQKEQLELQRLKLEKD